MAEGIRLVSVRRGVDPRRFAILAFGGAAGLHVTDVARQLGIRRVIVPRRGGGAVGLGHAGHRPALRDRCARHIGDARPARARRAARRSSPSSRARGGAAWPRRFAGPVRVQRAADMRYGEQIFEVGVQLDGVDLEVPDVMAAVADAFHRRHKELYTYALPDQEAVLVNARVAVVGVLPSLPREPALPARPPAAPCAGAAIYLGDWHSVPVSISRRWRRAKPSTGPALVESATTTVLCAAGDRARTTPLGWLDIAVGDVDRHGRTPGGQETTPSAPIAGSTCSARGRAPLSQLRTSRLPAAQRVNCATREHQLPLAGGSAPDGDAGVSARSCGAGDSAFSCDGRYRLRPGREARQAEPGLAHEGPIAVLRSLYLRGARLPPANPGAQTKRAS